MTAERRLAEPSTSLTWPRALRAALIGVGIVLAAAAAGAYYVTGPTAGATPGAPIYSTVSVSRLHDSVQFLSVDLGPRWFQNLENLTHAADWIGERFRETGLEVSRQEFHLAEGSYRNVIASRAGREPNAGVVIVGAHYDAYGEMSGADDNASGIAVLLELARTLPPAAPRRTQIFVAFANEEPPLFGSDEMGSARFAQSLQDSGTAVHLMVALDMVGYFSDEPGSQHFPLAGLGLLYPDAGNFIAVVGDLGAGRWIRSVKRGMRSSGTIPVFSFRGPSSVPGVDWSDHQPFRRRGLPGVLVTDTSFLRSPHYHRSTDTIETLDFPRMAAVVAALHGALAVADDEP